VTESAPEQDQPIQTSAPKSLAQLFHIVNRLIPEAQDVVAVSPTDTAGDALALMRKHGYSQLPVVQNGEVVGLFSYRAFSLEVAGMTNIKVAPTSLPVEEFLEHETPVFASLNDEFRGLIDHLDRRDAVIVSGRNNLIGLLTPLDVLRYLFKVANAFVLVEEIELSLRELLRIAVPGAEQLASLAGMILADKYKGRSLPKRFEEMTFDDYIALVRDGRGWPHFEAVLQGTRDLRKARLERVRDLRNDLFHFKRELSLEDHQTLTSCRSWLLRRTASMHTATRGML
jgi:CBS domain-containing protein